MRNFLQGRDVNLKVDFTVDGEPVSPDENTVSYSLYGNNGTVISGQENVSVSVGASATEASISLLAANNTLAAGLDIERRILLVTYDYVGQTRTETLAYRIHKLLNTSAAPEQVRAALGVSEQELPDSDIDIVSAYFELADETGATDLEEALASGTRLAAAADEAITLTAALQVIPSLRLRALQSRESDGSAASRFAKLDIFKLRSELASRLSELTEQISGAVSSELTMVATTSDTDLFGGA